MSKSKNLFLKALLRLLIVWWVVLLPSIPIASAAPVCSAQLVDSYFYNPDFESYSTLPNDWSYPNSSQVDRLNNWHQTTQGTTDFWHDNGVKDPGVLSPNVVGHATHLLPYSSTTTKGGAVGFITAKTEDYAEYVGQCLKNPLIAGKSYRLKMRIGYLDNTGFSTGGDVSGHLIALGRTACPSSIPLAGSDNKEDDADYTLLGATAINHQWENGWYNVEIDMNPSVNMPYVMFGLRKSSLVSERDNAYAIVDELVLNELTCIAPSLKDYGDAPSSYGSPSHTLAIGLRLGANAPDAEATALSPLNGMGDDASNIDDEDGIASFPTLIAGATSYSIPPATISATGTGTVHAWIDFNNNGVFTADEYASSAVVNGNLSDALSWSGINIGTAGATYARLRFTSTTLVDVLGTPAIDERAIMAANDGEVEDYEVAIVAANSPPIITSNGGGDSAVINIPEGNNTVTTVIATDADNDTLSYALAGGSDVALFTINASTGVLTFKAVPDYESPQDTGANNQYVLIVSTSDSKGGLDTQTLTINVTDMPEGVNLSIKALLQGSYDAGSGLMKDDLRVLNLIPLNQPYANYAAFNYSGAEAINSTRLVQSGLNAVVDWVIVELRNALNPNLIVARQAALLTRSGTIVSANKDSPNLHLLGVGNGSYYIALRHRNHLGIMSQSPIALTLGGTTHIDFSLMSTASYGINSRALIGESALMWAGNANLDAYIIANGPNNDTSNILSSVLMAKNNLLINSNYAYKGYLNTDIDMDGFAVFAGPDNDINVLVSNILLHPSNTTFSANYVVSGG